MSLPVLLSEAVGKVCELGHEKARLGQFEAALLCFKMAFALDGNCLPAMIDSANCSRELGRLYEAENDLRVVLSADPNNPWALHSMGIIRQRQDDDVQAAGYFLQAAAVDDHGFESDDSNALLATSLSRLGRHEEAVDLLKACVGRRPNDLSLNISLAEASLSLGDVAGAVDAARIAVSLDERRPTPVVMLVRGLERMGLHQEAHEALVVAKQKLGFTPELWALELESLRAQGRVADAHKLIDDVLERERILPASVFFAAAIFSIEAGAFDRADRLLSRAPSFSDHEKAQSEFVRARLSFFQGDFSAASQGYQDVQTLSPAWNLSLDRAQLGLWTLNLPLAYESLSGAVSSSPAHLAAISHYKGVLLAYQRSQKEIDRLHYLLGLGLPQKLSCMAQLVREHPESVPLSVAFIKEMMDAGIINSSPAIERSGSDKIPRSVIQYWESEVPADVSALTKNWATMNPEYNYYLFNIDSAGEFIRDNFPQDVFKGFVNAPHAARRANIFRYAYLYLYGGIYVDADERCLTPLLEWFPHHVTCVAAIKDLGVLNANFIAIEKNSPVMKTALEGAVRSIISRNFDPLWLTNGPGRFTTALAAYAADNYDSSTLDMTLISRNEESKFYSADLTLLYKNSADHWWIDEHHNLG